jgi:predicted acyl esterase
VLDRPVEVTGPIQLRLFAASSARDTDFTGKLVDVDGGPAPVRCFRPQLAALIWQLTMDSRNAFHRRTDP